MKCKKCGAELPDSANPSLLTDYAKLVAKAAEVDKSFEKWDGDLNDAESAYYLEVQTRVAQKLLAVAAE